MSTFLSLTNNSVQVKTRLAEAARRVGRDPDTVRLVAVTKTVDAARVLEAVAAGLTLLGENYVQEARAKIPEVHAAAAAATLTLPPTLEWHLIGKLQSNKAKYAVELFSLIHSVESLTLAQEIAKQASKRGKIQDILIEINLAEADGRSGVAPQDALCLAAEITKVSGIRLRGLMGIAPYCGAGDGGEAARPYFRMLRALWEQLPEENRHELSMGMSNDFEVAVEEGATLIRVGAALFGARKG